MCTPDVYTHLNCRAQLCKGAVRSQQGGDLMQGAGKGPPNSRVPVLEQLGMGRPQLWPLLQPSTGQHSREVVRGGQAKL